MDNPDGVILKTTFIIITAFIVKSFESISFNNAVKMYKEIIQHYISRSSSSDLTLVRVARLKAQRALESIEPWGRDTPSRLQTIAATKADSAVTSCPKSCACLEHTAQNTAGCMRGISCLYQQLSIVYIHNLNGETETRIYELRRYMKRKQSNTYHFE